MTRLAMSLVCISVTRALWKFQAQSPLLPPHKRRSLDIHYLVSVDHQTSFYPQVGEKALNLILII